METSTIDGDICNARPTKKYLKPDAVPSVFDFPPHLVKKIPPRKPPVKRPSPPLPEVPISPKKKQERILEKVKLDHGSYFKSPTKEIAKLKKRLKFKNEKIRSLRCKNIRKEKSLHLPNPATIRSWAMSMDCEPGFLQQVIDHLQLNMKDDKKDCVLLVDEMSIKKEVLWDAKLKKFTGNVDYGPILAEEQDTNAHNALVIMAVGLKQP